MTKREKKKALKAKLQEMLFPKERIVDHMHFGFKIYSSLEPLARLECKDGFSVSMQANACAYCTPRNDDGPWRQVELGFPSKAEELLMPYIEIPPSPNDPEAVEKPENQVYPYVPLGLVVDVVLKHGGLA